MRPQECVLDDILGFRSIARDQVGRAERHLLVLRHEARKCLAVAGPGRAHCSGVIEFRVHLSLLHRREGAGSIPGRPGGTIPLMEPVFFESASEFRSWLEANHARETAIWLGYWKKSSGRTGITYFEALEEALCYGWIDSQARSIDASAYSQRWTPRKSGSIWSRINIGRMDALIASGRAAEPGIRAFERRTDSRSGVYSHEQPGVAISPEQEAAFTADSAARAFWEKQPPSYRKPATRWVASAKQQVTRDRRLVQLLAACRDGRRLSQFVSPGKR
jgi:uncharacterized protein YdeI (YjbR/CyaY-like superfamily)